MKKTGIVRKIDRLGRITIPYELRKSFQLNEHDKIEFYTEDEKVVMKKYQPYGACFITGKVLPENKRYASGFFLSTKGATILLKQLNNLGVLQL